MFNQQYTNVTKHSTHKENRKITKTVHKLSLDPNFKFSTEQTRKAITSSKNNTSTGPDNIKIQHLKHLGPAALNFLTDIYNLSIQQNIIPQIWKLAKIIPIPKPNKDPNQGSSYRLISLLSSISKLLRKAHTKPNSTIST